MGDNISNQAKAFNDAVVLGVGFLKITAFDNELGCCDFKVERLEPSSVTVRSMAPQATNGELPDE